MTDQSVSRNHRAVDDEKRAQAAGERCRTAARQRGKRGTAKAAPAARRNAGKPAPVRSAAPAGSRKVDAAARREAILDAALTVFAERGYEAARLDDMAARAGVAKGTLYLYFKDKEALFEALVRGAVSPMLGKVARVRRGPRHEGGRRARAVLRDLPEGGARHQAQAAAAADHLRGSALPGAGGVLLPGGRLAGTEADAGGGAQRRRQRRILQ